MEKAIFACPYGKHNEVHQSVELSSMECNIEQVIQGWRQQSLKSLIQNTDLHYLDSNIEASVYPTEHNLEPTTLRGRMGSSAT